MTRYTQEALAELHAELGWDFRNDDFEVCIGGTSVYEIDGNNTKWSPTKGTRKYNKDAFIVIKRVTPITPSQPDSTLVAHHLNTSNDSTGVHQGEHAPSDNT